MVELGTRVDRWERIRIAYDYCRATEPPDRGHEAYRAGAELADAAAAMARTAGLHPRSGRPARDAVLRELRPYAHAGAILRLRRRWALARDPAPR